VVAYNLILGCLPFKVEVEGMFERKYTWDAFSKSEIVGLNEEILALLKGLLEKDPSNRWTPSQALASELFTNPQVTEKWREFNKRKVKEAYNKVLKL
jgi:serine/threonine protein kinase